MKPPLTNLEGARIVRATHTTGQDSLRLEFERDILLIVYNDVRLDSVRCSIVDPPCEFTRSVGCALRPSRAPIRSSHSDFHQERRYVSAWMTRPAKVPKPSSSSCPGIRSS
jgi:hypothetical protein